MRAQFNLPMDEDSFAMNDEITSQAISIVKRHYLKVINVSRGVVEMYYSTNRLLLSLL